MKRKIKKGSRFGCLRVVKEMPRERNNGGIIGRVFMVECVYCGTLNTKRGSGLYYLEGNQGCACQNSNLKKKVKRTPKYRQAKYRCDGCQWERYCDDHKYVCEALDHWIETGKRLKDEDSAKKKKSHLLYLKNFPNDIAMVRMYFGLQTPPEKDMELLRSIIKAGRNEHAGSKEFQELGSFKDSYFWKIGNMYLEKYDKERELKILRTNELV